MRRVRRVVGITFIAIAGVLGLFALITWEPGGLLFALPYFFLWPALLFAIVGFLLLFSTRRPRGATPVDTQDGKNPKSAT